MPIWGQFVSRKTSRYQGRSQALAIKCFKRDPLCHQAQFACSSDILKSSFLCYLLGGALFGIIAGLAIELVAGLPHVTRNPVDSTKSLAFRPGGG